MALRIPRIVWGDTLNRTLDFRLPMHAPMPRRSWVGEVAEAPSGEIDAWRDGLFAELEFDLRWIPGASQAGQSGWYGATGVEAFLAWARDRKPFRLYLDRTDAGFRTCKLIEAEEGREDSKAQYYRFRMKVRDMAGVPFEV